MNDQFLNSNSLLLAYQQDSSSIPTDFTITCLLSTKPKGIFESSFHVDELIVCGTSQGPIVLVGFNKNAKMLKRVSLLCGHSYRITDFEETLQGDNFLSISANCTICQWSLRDGSCLLHTDLSLPLNDYKLSICPSGLSLVWIWAAGSDLYLFDLEKEQIIYTLSIGGINSFSILSPHTSYCVSSTCAICSTISKLILYSIKDDQTFEFLNDIPTPDFLVQTTKVCQRGLIQYNSKNGNWSILRPHNSSIILSGTFQLDEDDYISGVDWNFSSFFCIATFKGRFLIVTIKKSTNSNQSIPKIEIESKKLFKTDSFINLLTFCLIGSSGVIFSPDSRSIVLLSDDSQFVLKPNKNDRQFNIVESYNCQPYVVYSDGKSTLSFYNAGIQMSDSKRYTFDGKITAIYARNSNMSNTLQIVNGYSDGRVTFWNFGTDIDKAITVCALMSPIIALIEIPYKLSGRQLLLAISNNECCVFKATDMYVMFNLGSIFSILSIHYIINSKYLVFALNNGSFIVFSIDNSEPLFALSKLPQNCVLLYSYFYSYYIENSSSTVCLRLANRSTWYQFLDISRIHRFDLHDESNNQIINSLNIIYKQIYESTSRKRSLSTKTRPKKDIINDDTNNAIQNDNINNSNAKSYDEKDIIVKRKDSIGKSTNYNKLYSSLVIIGKRLNPTFFYPPFCVNLENILHASPIIAAKHFLIKRLVAKMKSINDTSYKQDAKRFVNFVPILIKLMYETPQDSEIQQICAETCASLNFLVSFVKAQSFVSPLLINYRYKDINSYSDHELLMMSLFTARYHNVIPVEILPKLLNFLLNQPKKFKNKPSIISAMSTFILIDGIHIWQKLFRDDSFNFDINESDNDGSNNSNSTNSPNINRKKILKKKNLSDDLYFSIIKSVIINKPKYRFLYDRFLNYVYSEDISFLVQLLPKFVKKYLSSISLPPVPSSLNIPIPPVKQNTFLAEAALDLYSEIELNNDKISSGWLSVAISSVGWKFPQLAKKAYMLMLKHAKVLPYVDVRNKTVIIGTSSGYIFIYVDSKQKADVKMFSDKVNYVSVGPNEECGLGISEYENSGKIFKVKGSPTIIHVMEIFHPPKGTKFTITWLKNDNASITFLPI